MRYGPPTASFNRQILFHSKDRTKSDKVPQGSQKPNVLLVKFKQYLHILQASIHSDETTVLPRPK